MCHGSPFSFASPTRRIAAVPPARTNSLTLVRARDFFPQPPHPHTSTAPYARGATVSLSRFAPRTETPRWRECFRRFVADLIPRILDMYGTCIYASALRFNPSPPPVRRIVLYPPLAAQSSTNHLRLYATLPNRTPVEDGERRRAASIYRRVVAQWLDQPILLLR